MLSPAMGAEPGRKHHRDQLEDALMRKETRGQDNALAGISSPAKAAHSKAAAAKITR